MVAGSWKEGSTPARAGTLTAVATMGAISLVAVLVVLGWARLGGDADAEEEQLEAIPSQMAGGVPPGEVPAPVVDALGDAPVVGVARLEELPPGVQDDCSMNVAPVQWDEGDPTIEHGYLTPDALTVSLVGSGSGPPGMFGKRGRGAPDKLRLFCTASDHDGAWITEGGGVEPYSGEGGGGSIGGGYSCCDENGLATASGSVAVPEEATWALQDRNGWYLAYPVEDTQTLAVTWKFQEQRFGPGVPPQSTITFTDDEGTIIDEAFAGGEF